MHNSDTDEIDNRISGKNGTSSIDNVDSSWTDTLAIVDLTLTMRTVAMTLTTKALGLRMLTLTVTLMMLMRVALALMMSVDNSCFGNDFFDINEFDDSSFYIC